MGLLLLGIGAALSTDIFNQSSNKYRNDIPLSAKIISETPLQESAGATIQISLSEFTSHYNVKHESDINLPFEIISAFKDTEYHISIKLNEAAPEIWKEMAKAAGNHNQLEANVVVKQYANNVYQIELLFESVSFVKLKEVTNSAIDYAKTAVNIALGLIGIMALWLGVMKVAEDAGLIRIIARLLTPITRRIFPDVPSDHPAMGSMIMNISANMLGLGNAATPFGLKAMEELNKLNPDKGTATNAMVTFLAINTAGLTLIPATAIAVRASSGSSDPTIIIGTSIFGALCATIAGITAAKILEKFLVKFVNFGDWIRKSLKSILIAAVILISLILLISTGFYKNFEFLFSWLSPSAFKEFIQIVSTLAIPVIIISFIGYGAIKKVKVYEQFVEGAKEGFNVAVRIIPYLVAMLMAIGIFRAGGAMDWLVFGLTPVTDIIGMPAEALPMALMRPLSGSGSLGIMAEIMAVHGPDSFIGVLVSTFFGSTETTFYVLAVYFGAINIKNTRHALPAGLIADLAGMLGALFIVRLLFF